ncbi:MAG: energy transducer TonB [Pseudomonadota bacterium]
MMINAFALLVRLPVFVIALSLFCFASSADAADRRKDILRNRDLITAMNTAVDHSTNGKPEEAYAIMQAFQSQEPLSTYESYKLTELKGYLAAKTNRFEEAVAAYESIISSEYMPATDRSRQNNQLQILYLKAGMEAKAIAMADATVFGPTSSALDYETVSSVRLQTGDFQAGLMVAERGIEHQRATDAWPTAKLLKNALYGAVKLNQKARAQKHIETLVGLYPAPIHLKYAMRGYAAIDQPEKTADLKEQILDQMRVEARIWVRGRPIVPIAPRVSEALAAGAIGKEVRLSYDISADGTIDPQTLKVISNTGQDALADAAKQALLKWRFMPKKVSGLLVRRANRSAAFSFEVQRDAKALRWFDTEPSAMLAPSN